MKTSACCVNSEVRTVARRSRTWKEQCGAVHGEIDVLLAAGWPETAEERQVRKIQFMALIERRNVAAQNFIKSDRERATSSEKPSEIPGLSNADRKPEVEIVNAEISQEPFEAPGDIAHAILRCRLPTHCLRSETS